jgi:hypothetical protein
MNRFRSSNTQMEQFPLRDTMICEMQALYRDDENGEEYRKEDLPYGAAHYAADQDPLKLKF